MSPYIGSFLINKEASDTLAQKPIFGFFAHVLELPNNHKKAQNPDTGSGFFDVFWLPLVDLFRIKYHSEILDFSRSFQADKEILEMIRQ